jgi:hypothetical protein
MNSPYDPGAGHASAEHRVVDGGMNYGRENPGQAVPGTGAAHGQTGGRWVGGGQAERLVSVVPRRRAGLGGDLREDGHPPLKCWAIPGRPPEGRGTCRKCSGLALGRGGVLRTARWRWFGVGAGVLPPLAGRERYLMAVFPGCYPGLIRRHAIGVVEGRRLDGVAPSGSSVGQRGGHEGQARGWHGSVGGGGTTA